MADIIINTKKTNRYFDRDSMLYKFDCNITFTDARDNPHKIYISKQDKAVRSNVSNILSEFNQCVDDTLALQLDHTVACELKFTVSTSSVSEFVTALQSNTDAVHLLGEASE